MIRRVVLGILAAAILGGGGAFAWMKTHPPPPPPAPSVEERGYKEIPRDEYQEWMQDLGYTE